MADTTIDTVTVPRTWSRRRLGRSIGHWAMPAFTVLAIA
jgi:hypothetical protein